MTLTSLSLGLDIELFPVGPAPHIAPVIHEGVLTLVANPGADLFVDPASSPGSVRPQATRYMGQVSGDFSFSAHVTAATALKFDSGVLLVWVDEDNWAKLCVEQDTAQNQRLVSVVTRGFSDDANGPFLESATSYLRIVRSGNVFGLHASADGVVWDLQRYFSLGDLTGKPVSIGVLAQSPAGPGCTARFSRFKFAAEAPQDFRSGL